MRYHKKEPLKDGWRLRIRNMDEMGPELKKKGLNTRKAMSRERTNVDKLRRSTTYSE
jgi:hypothetical protein